MSSYTLIDNIYSSENFTDPRMLVHATKPSDIIGYPMTFYETADPSFKAGANRYGRVEFNTLVKDMPLIFIQPGKAKYLPGKTLLGTITGKDQSNAETLYKALQDIDQNGDSSANVDAINKIQNTGGLKYDSRYYGFKPAYDEYLKFLNSMSAYTLVRMKLHESDFRLSGMGHSDNWMQKLMVPIYADTSATRFSESGSNNTAESMLSGYIKNAGSLSREVDFIFNGQINKEELHSRNSKNALQKLGKMASDLVGGSDVGNALSHILTGTKTVINGGNLLFPEIWQDSQYRKSYEIGIKLWSPYGDPLSIYNNIIHPLLSLLTLALPRQLNKQGYATPFLLKVFSKGWFSCDMGMVESITINKGGASGKEWTDDGYPLAVDVTLSIKDLYPTIMQSIGKSADIYAFNTGMLEFLDCLAGANVGDVDYMLGIKSSVFDKLLGNTLLDRLKASLTQSGLSNSIHQILGTVSEVDDTLSFVVNNIKGVLGNAAEFFKPTDSTKSSTEGADGKGNYTQIEVNEGDLNGGGE